MGSIVHHPEDWRPLKPCERCALNDRPMKMIQGTKVNGYWSFKCPVLGCGWEIEQKRDSSD